MQGAVRDLAFAFRLARRSPGLTCAIVLTLAVGVAVTTAVFGAVNAIFFQPLPYPSPDRLVAAHQFNPRFGRSQLVAPADFSLWAGRVSAFEEAGAIEETAFSFALGTAPDEVRGARVSPSLFRLFGARPVLGRALSDADGRPGAAPVVVISERLWQRRFPSALAVVGRTIRLDGVEATIVGVLPASFKFINSGLDAFAPLHPDLRSSPRSQLVVARLKPGIAIARAEAELRAISSASAASSVPDESGWEPGLRPLGDVMWGDARPVYRLLLAGALLLLLLICANVSNLLLARAVTRRREFAVRAVLGAGHAGIARQLLAEGGAIAAVSGVLGLAVCAGLRQLLVATYPEASDLRVDARVFAFAFGVSALAGLALGAIPALSVCCGEQGQALRSGWSAATRTGGRTGRILAAVQLAAAAALLAASGLLIRSAFAIRAIDPGFHTGAILTARVEPPRAGFDEGQRRAFYDDVLGRVERLGGVRRAAWTSVLPLDGGLERVRLEVEGRPSPEGGEWIQAGYKAVSHSYFGVLGLTHLAGEGFAAAVGDAAVAVVNRTCARALFASDRAAVGARIRVNGGPWRRVVGVVADARQVLTEPPAPEVYVPFLAEGARYASLLVATSGDPAASALAVRAAIREAAPDATATALWSMSAIVDSYFPAPIAGAFGGLGLAALLLGAMGIYAVVSHLVAQRTHELGVRAALGADRHRLLWLVLKDGLGMALRGGAAGLVGAFLLGLALSRSLPGVVPADVVVFAGTVTVLAAVAVLASLAPAWRAVRVPASVSLRCE